MPLKITQRREQDITLPGRTGRVNEDLVALKEEMKNLGSGMVLEILAGDGKSERAVKGLVSRAANEMGARWEHWNVGSKVYARPVGGVKRRGRPEKAI